MAPAVLTSPVGPDEVEVPSRLDEDGHFEIIDGERVELPPISNRSARIATKLATKLSNFCDKGPGGWVLAEGKFRIGRSNDPNRSRKPDVAWVSFERRPRETPEGTEDVWPEIPELIAEVISPSDTLLGLRTRLRDYFAAGVRRVWVIEPDDNVAWEHTAPMPGRMLGVDDHLDGGDLLPGFRLRLGDLLAPPPPAGVPSTAEASE